MDQTIDVIVNEVLYRLGHTSKVHLVQGLDYSNMNARRHGFPEYITRVNELNSNVALLLPELGLSQMMSIASGMPIDDLSRWATEALLRGISVLVDYDSVAFYTMPYVENPFYLKHAEALNLLIASGLEVFRHDTSIKRYDGKLLCEKQVDKWYREGVQQFSLNKNCLITPAAMDAIRTYQLKWIKE